MSYNFKGGPRAVYEILNNIESALLRHDDSMTITFGDITEIDLNKTEIFPLTHITINTVTFNGNNLMFNLSIFLMDLVWENKNSNISEEVPNSTGEQIKDNPILGLTNELDVINSRLAIANYLNELFRRGDLFSKAYQIDGQPTCEPFYDRFENKLAGWVYTTDILVPNDISVCDE